MKEFVIGAEIFTRLTRLFLGVGSWDYDLIIYSNRYYLVVSENNYTSYAFFEIDELQVSEYRYPIKLRLSTQFIQTFRSLLIKQLSEDIRFLINDINDEGKVTIVYNGQRYIELISYSSFDEQLLSRKGLQYREEANILANILAVLKIGATYLTHLDVYSELVFGYTEDKTLAILYENSPELNYSYRITNPRLFYSLYGKLYTEDPVTCYSNAVFFTFSIKLGNKERVSIRTGFFGVNFLSVRDESFINLLHIVCTDGTNLEITQERIASKLQYIATNVKNKEIRADSLVFITADCKLNTQDFLRIFKSIGDLVRVKLYNRILYIQTSTVSFLVSLYFEVKAEKENVPDDARD